MQINIAHKIDAVTWLAHTTTWHLRCQWRWQLSQSDHSQRELSSTTEDYCGTWDRVADVHSSLWSLNETQPRQTLARLEQQ